MTSTLLARIGPILAVMLLALGMRLINVNAPPLGVHSWRQADTASIARNFAREGYAFAYPRVDFRGDGPGFVETEFPLYPYCSALVYWFTGPADWVPRALSALAAMLTVGVLFLLVRQMVNAQVALWASLFYAILPLNIYYGRTIQPESWLLLSTVCGVYAFARWSATRSDWWLLASWVGITLACLLKLPTLFIGLPLAAMAFQALGWRALRSVRLWAFALLLMGCVAAWYRHAHAVGQTTGLSFGILNDPKHNPLGTLLDPEFYNIIVFRRLAERLFTWPGFVVLVLGLLARRRSRSEYIFDFWLVGVVVYFGIAAFNNKIHEYYQLPIMLPGVVYLGKVFAQHWAARKVVLAIALLLIAGSSMFRLNEYFGRERPGVSIDWEVAAALRQSTDANELVVVVDPKLPTNPTVLYLADRKGWTPTLGSLTRSEVGELARRGARAIAGTKTGVRDDQEQRRLNKILTDYAVAYESENAFVVRLDQPRRPTGSR